MEADAEENGPFRWDLVTPDHLGTLLAGTAPPSLWFLDELVSCAGKVLARSGDADLIFVGRSLDSMFDLLGGALADLRGAPRLSRLPLSFRRDATGSSRQRSRNGPAERAVTRLAEASAGDGPWDPRGYFAASTWSETVAWTSGWRRTRTL